MKYLSALLAVLVLVVFALSLLAGRVWLSPQEIVSRSDTLASLIVTDIRLPRAVLALLVGGALGLSGAVLQGLTRNPLAEPGLLGVSTGAALGAVLAIYFGVTAISGVAGPMLGLAGALGASLLTFGLGQGGGTITLVLAGAAVSSLTAAGIALALNFAPNPYAAYEIMNWLLGSLADKSWDQVWLILPFILIGGGLLATTGQALDALSLGEAQAESLGVDLTRLRIAAIAGTALAVGAATSVTGAIGFIGLVAPHLARPFVGYQPSRILLPATLGGALLLLIADIAARQIHLGPELKLGVFTSLVGTPFFFWLVLRLETDFSVREAMSVLLAEHIDVNKGDRVILHDVSLMAGPGEFVAVIGPNGAGKSTLLSALAGLIAPAKGVISLDGVLLSKISKKSLARRRAYLPQNPLCEWPLSVERLVALGLTAHLSALGPLPDGFDAAIAKALEDHDLAARREQPVTTLSGGEFSRAMLARAMVGSPALLIADEPVTGLDPVHAFAAMARLSAWAAAGHAVIASLHDLTLAGRYASRIIALKDGRVAGEGALDGTLIRNVFGVPAEIRGTGTHFAVDFLSPKPEPDADF